MESQSSSAKEDTLRRLACGRKSASAKGVDDCMAHCARGQAEASLVVSRLWSPSRKGQEKLAVPGYSPAHVPADQSPGAGPVIHPSFHINSLGLIDQEA